MLLPPSVFLPQTKGISNCSKKDITDAVARLSEIYLHPQVRGSTRRLRKPSGSGVLRTHDQNIAILSADPFERSFAIQWLTRFISVSSELSAESEETAWGEAVLEQAASILAVCAGTAASGTIKRVFAFPCTLPDMFSKNDSFLNLPQDPDTVVNSYTCIQTDSNDIQVVLHDAPLESADSSSVGAQTWGAACVLAEMIAERPENFGISIPKKTLADRRTPFRALELGAGTGLASLVLAKVLDRVGRSNFPDSAPEDMASTERPRWREEPDTVVATDFHPSVLANLKRNIENNFSSSVEKVPAAQFQSIKPDFLLPSHPSRQFSKTQIIALPLDWSLLHKSSPSTTVNSEPGDSQPAVIETATITGRSPLTNEPFDLIIGADIIYEPLHARWVRSCVERFLRRPSMRLSQSPAPPSSPAHPSVSLALFHLVIPLRRTHSVESNTIEEVFAFASDIVAARKVNHDVSLTSILGDNDVVRHKTRTKVVDSSSLPEPVLAILDWEEIVCDAYLDTSNAEEVVYRYYKIGWI